MSHREPVVIIGAGLAGLSAARALRRADVEVLVLERENRVGG
ncbi:MAG TPA: FAD-dependent oxidoreductase, partial [Proteobacteria bacterium]|nr:FAD-dependent oxidoreductase [Pseudomonadota bacterium]